jgi:YD repeat-containing protein
VVFYRKKLFPIALLVLLYDAAHAVNLEKYNPVKNGAAWNYLITAVDNNPNSIVPPPQNFTESIIANPQQTAGIYKLVTTLPNSSAVNFRKDPFRGITRISVDEQAGCSYTLSGNQLILPLHMNYGETSSSQITSNCPQSQATVQASRKMISNDVITVPAGTFKTILFEQTSYFGGNVISTEKVWLAEGVGRVKSEMVIPFPVGGLVRTNTTVLLSTNFTPDEVDDDDECDCTQTSDGVGLGYATGSVSLHEADVTPTPYSPLSFTRSYKGNSGIDDGSLGAGWAHNYSRRAGVYSYAALGGSETVMLYRESGATFLFSNNNGTWVSANDLRGKVNVTRNGATIIAITYRSASDEIEAYDAMGRLQSITYPGGMKTTLAYDTLGRLLSATDNFGKKLSFAYDGAGHLSSVTPSNGNAVSYTFGSDGQLDKVTLLEQKTRQYAYDVIRDAGNLDTAIRIKSVVRSGTEYLKFLYDDKGRVLSRSYGAGVGGTAIDYTDASSRVIHDSLSAARTVTFTMVLGRNRRLSLSSQCNECEDGGTATRRYDAFGNIIERTDFKGTKTTYAYDTARGLQISRTEAYGTALARTVTTTWHAQFRRPLAISEPLRRTNYEYDTSGNVLKETVQATSDNSGSLGFNATLLGEARTYTYTYGPGGRLLTAVGPRKDLTQKTEYTYDASGNLTKVTDAAGLITALSNHDADGRPRRITQPNGTIVDSTFTPAGLLASVTITADGHSEETKYDYNEAGQVQTISLPDQGFYSFAYDAAERLIEVADHIGNRVDFDLDSQGNRLAEKLYGPNGAVVQQLSRSFDSQGRLKQQIGGL